MSHDNSERPERTIDAVVDACAVVVGLGVMALNRFQAVRRQVVSASRASDRDGDDRPDDRPDGDGPTS